MSADIINLYQRRNDEGRDTLSTVREYFECLPQIDAMMPKGDKFLAWLWMRGYKVVPLSDDDIKP